MARLRICASLVALLLATFPASAQVSPEAEATRIQLITQAQAAQTAGDHDRALDLAQRAVQVRASPSLWRLIAREQTALGRFAEALVSGRRCVDGATADPSVPERAATLESCNALIHDAEQHVGSVVVTAPTPLPEGLQVRVAGAPLANALLGIAYVVSPGTVTIVATAAGRRPFEQDVQVAVGASVPVSLVLPSLAPVVRPAPASVSVPIHLPVATTTAHVQGPFRLSPLVWIGGGVAIVSMATAIGLGVGGSGTAQSFDMMCAQPATIAVRTRCLAMQSSVSSSLSGRSGAVDAMWGLAIAGAITAVVGVVLSGHVSESTPHPGVTASLWVSPREAGAQLRW